MKPSEVAASVAVAVYWLKQSCSETPKGILLVPPDMQPHLLHLAQEFRKLLARNCELQDKLSREGKAGRKPMGERPLTNAEKVARYRARKAARKGK